MVSIGGTSKLRFQKEERRGGVGSTRGNAWGWSQSGNGVTREVIRWPEAHCTGGTAAMDVIDGGGGW
jgi:hypothetical protein